MTHRYLDLFFESCSEPSSVSLSVVASSAFCLRLGTLVFFVPCNFFGLSFRFVCIMRRSIFRCAVLIIISCFSIWRLGLSGFAFFFFLRDFESCHNTSVVTSHVNCIVGLRVFAPAVVFSVSQNVVQMFPATFRSVVRYLFLRYLLIHCVQCDKILFQVTIESSIRLCSSLCRVCSDQHLIIQYQLPDQAQR